MLDGVLFPRALAGDATEVDVHHPVAPVKGAVVFPAVFRVDDLRVSTSNTDNRLVECVLQQRERELRVIVVVGDKQPSFGLNVFFFQNSVNIACLGKHPTVPSEKLLANFPFSYN